MTKTRKRKRRKRREGSSRPARRVLVPGQWQTAGEAPKDPGAGFMEVAMVALDAPDAPAALRGHAAQMLLFHAIAPDEVCPCGSGRLFSDCHRDPRRVPLLCRDLGGETCSEIVACETTFPVHDDEAAARLLKVAPELRLTQEIPGRVFWQFIGHPRLETPAGDIVFATVELNPGRLYFVTLSQQRNETIILTLANCAGDSLGAPLTRQSEVEFQYRRMIK